MARFSENFRRRAQRVHFAVRSKAGGKPRLSVFRSERQMYAQIIDDINGKTICSASTLEKNFRSDKKSNCDASARVGALIAAKAAELGIKEVVFDRGGYSYHGRVKALADGARSGGLVF